MLAQHLIAWLHVLLSYDNRPSRPVAEINLRQDYDLNDSLWIITGFLLSSKWAFVNQLSKSIVFSKLAINFGALVQKVS